MHVKYRVLEDSNRVSADDVMPTIPDHQTERGGYIALGQDMGEQFRLMIQLAARN